MRPSFFRQGNVLSDALIPAVLPVLLLYHVDVGSPVYSVFAITMQKLFIFFAPTCPPVEGAQIARTYGANEDLKTL